MAVMRPPAWIQSTSLNHFITLSSVIVCLLRTQGARSYSKKSAMPTARLRRGTTRISSQISGSAVSADSPARDQVHDGQEHYGSEKRDQQPGQADVARV